MDETIQREYGDALAGQVSGKRFVERPSVIAGLSGGKALAPWVFNGYCDTDVVLTWVKPVPGPWAQARNDCRHGYSHSAKLPDIVSGQNPGNLSLLA